MAIGIPDEDDDTPISMQAGPSYPRRTPAEPTIDETWTQVEELPDADDSDYTDEEVEYITLDLGRDFPPDVLKQVDNIQLTNLNSKEPWIRVGPHILRGRHERMLGSDILLELPTAESDSGKTEEVTPLATTQARVTFQSIKLLPKSRNPTIPAQNASSYLLPKGGLPTSSGRGRGKGSRGGGRGARGAATGTRGKGDTEQGEGREGSAMSEGTTGTPAASGAVEAEQSEPPSEAMPNVEEFDM